MKYPILAALALAGWSVATVAQAQAPADAVVVSNPWARASAGAATTGAAYLTVVANGQADSLTGASTPAAAKAEVHQTIAVNGVMQMRSVPAIPLEPGKPVTLAPGGYHVMLMGLQHPLKPDETFPLTLTFEHAKPVTVTVKVGAVGAAASGGHDMHGMTGMAPAGTTKP